MKEVLLLLFGDEFREYFSLTARQKFYVWYFCLSLCFLCITDDSPIWAIIVVVLNFANAARLIKKVPLNIKDYKSFRNVPVFVERDEKSTGNGDECQ